MALSQFVNRTAPVDTAYQDLHFDRVYAAKHGDAPRCWACNSQPADGDDGLDQYCRAFDARSKGQA